MKTIELHSRKYAGLRALIDDEEFESLSKYHWLVLRGAGKGSFYAYANAIVDGEKRQVSMSRMILGLPCGNVEVDHKDGNTLNNQKENLRTCSHSQNLMNQNKQGKISASGYKGVSFHRKTGLWHARVHAAGKTYSFGYHKTPFEAARVRDREAIRIHGEFANLNF